MQSTEKNVPQHPAVLALLELGHDTAEVVTCYEKLQKTGTAINAPLLLQAIFNRRDAANVTLSFEKLKVGREILTIEDLSALKLDWHHTCTFKRYKTCLPFHAQICTILKKNWKCEIHQFPRVNARVLRGGVKITPSQNVQIQIMLTSTPIYIYILD